MKKKYYIKCGELKVIVLANGPKAAAMRALDKHIKNDMTLDPDFIRVNETGFFSMKSKATYHYSTIGLLKRLGFEFMEG